MKPMKHIGLALILLSGACTEKGDSGAYVREGLNHMVEGDVREAVDSFKRAILVDPNNADAYAYLGRVYYELHDVQEATSHWREALRIDPKNATTLSPDSECRCELCHAPWRSEKKVLHALRPTL